MDNQEFDRTAFVTYHGLFKYLWMLSRLKIAPVTFQQAMTVILASVKNNSPF